MRHARRGQVALHRRQSFASQLRAQFVVGVAA